MTYDPNRALALLRLGSGSANAVFREGQQEAIRHVVEGAGRLLVVQKTGWGKSFVYFIATQLLRDSGAGPTLLISPLLALMRNQLAAASRMGVRAATINSDNQSEWGDVEAALAKNEIDILLTSPERLNNDRFITTVLPSIAGRIALVVVDEAHCISDWGHDFRPQYRRIERLVRQLPPNVRLLATTATANNRVMGDLKAVLGPGLASSRGDLNRPSLTLQTIRLPDQAERLAWLAENIPSLSGSGVVYALTVRDAELVADWLESRGLNVAAYTGQTGDMRPELEQSLSDNRVKALVATPALGMGYDKPDLAFVIHYQVPGSVVAYYQQVGRAGRALDHAYGVLLSGKEDTDITNFFIESAFPTRQEVEAVLNALEAAPSGLSVNDLLGAVNISKGRVDKTIELLSLESPAPLAKQGSKWQLTASTLNDGFWQRAARLTALRRAEQKEMQEYVTLSSGHMQFLIRALDGDASPVTGASLSPLKATVDPHLVREAVAFLRRTNLPIEPRKQWPPGGLLTRPLNGRISAERLARPGRVLCRWGDSGWGALVRRGKHVDGRFDDLLVSACVEVVRQWLPQPEPAWVTCVPSERHPRLVPDFAARLARALGLPFVPVLSKVAARSEQKLMANSTQQARNVDGALAVIQPPPTSPVLLVDDTVSSRWTFTVAAWLLREHGSGDVWPLALAMSEGDE